MYEFLTTLLKIILSDYSHICVHNNTVLWHPCHCHCHIVTFTNDTKYDIIITNNMTLTSLSDMTPTSMIVKLSDNSVHLHYCQNILNTQRIVSIFAKIRTIGSFVTRLSEVTKIWHWRHCQKWICKVHR